MPITKRSEWQELKKKHGIPDKVCSFVMGEHIESWHKKLATATSAKDHKARLAAIEGLLKDFKTYETALKKVKPEKFKGKTATEQANSKKAAETAVHAEVQFCEGQQQGIAKLANPLATLKQHLAPIRQTLNGLSKTNLDGLQDFYSAQYRNELGKYVAQALAQNPTGKLKAALDNYVAAGNVADDLIDKCNADDTATMAKIYAAMKMGVDQLATEV